jgi:hypothetical protein
MIPTTTTTTTTPSSPTSRLLGVGLILLLSLFAVWRSAIGTALDGFTIDEPWHIVAGTSYARGEGFHLNPEHPPLVKRWVGTAMPADFRLPPPKPLHEKEEERRWVQETMYRDNVPAKAQAVSRPAMWLLNGLLLLVLGLLAWRAFGLPWAIGTLAFLALEPTVAGHMPVVMTDLPLGLTLAIAALCAGILATRWQWRWALATGLAMGLALTAKHSALAGLGGVGLLLVGAALWRVRSAPREALRALAMAGATAVLAVVVLWGAYDFRFKADPDGRDHYNRPIAEKIDELRLPHWKATLAFADRHALLPESYLWGLADTVRTGVEGRSGGLFRIWGTVYEGAPPWFSWPAILVAKLPLGLLVLALAGLVASVRAARSPAVRWPLLAVGIACAFHMAALVGSGGVWGGVRHALPVIVGLAVVAGAVLAWAWARRSHAWVAVALLPYVAVVAMTLREPSAWEYHNELVGGTDKAYRYFDNEGLGLGQRYPQLRDYYRRVIAPSGLPLYSRFAPEEILRADAIRFRLQVETLDDTNTEGKLTGWFVMNMKSLLPVPQADWDPKRDLRGRTLVARFGPIGVWKGTQNDPRGRADALGGRVLDYIYKENGKDWAKVALRLEEVLKELPMAVPASFELGNAYVRLGKRADAIRAYDSMFVQKQMPIDALVAKQVHAQIDALKAGTPMDKLPPLRSPWLE